MNPYAVPVPIIDWPSILPMTLVIVTGMVALLVEIMRPKATNGPIVVVTLIGLALAFLTAIPGLNSPNLESFGGMVLRDSFGTGLQLILIGVAFTVVLFSDAYLVKKRIAHGEFYPLILWSTAGAMMMVATQNLLMVFIGLEVLSISLYVMTGIARREEKSEESALKYFLLGAFASGFLLYGISFVYGATGGLSLDNVPAALHANAPFMRVLLGVGLALILIGVAFKSSMVPFHQWTPDVYQGSPTNVTAFMSSASKIGALGVLWRVLEAFGGLQDLWLPALFWVAILTMTVGNLVALVQKDIKRIFGYSSISHAGYILVAVLAHAKDPSTIGSGTLFYYLLSYSLMTVGGLAVITMVARGDGEATDLTSLHGLWNRSPLAAGSLVVFMLSLVGLPPTAGFFGKLLIFSDALNAGLAPLAIVLAVNSIISCYYYLGIAKAAFVSDGEGDSAPQVMPSGLRWVCAACVAGIFISSVLVGPLKGLTHPAAPALSQVSALRR